MNKKNIEVEGGELLLMSEEGHYAVIPAKDRNKIQGMVADGCIDCINEYIKELPKESDYAEDGSLLPSWKTVKAKLNPKNWFVPDLTDQGSFNTAYDIARKDGRGQFMWNNERYSSDLPIRDDVEFGTPRIIRDRIYNAVTPEGYPLAEIENTIGRTLRGEGRRMSANPDEDAWAFYMGLPQSSNTTVVPSRYTPTTSTDQDAKYFTISGGELKTTFHDRLLENASRNFKESDSLNERVKPTIIQGSSSFTPLQNVSYSRGSDARGDYYSIYDVYDFDVPLSDKIGKPYEVYDRVYYKDYDGSGNPKPMFYTDDELLNINPDSPEFDPYYLQRELMNRGVELPLSTKKNKQLWNYERDYGHPDGIFGPETRNALTEYQNRLRGNKP
jgi:peptidoglycan hydrolase-like protein with peptidoglycan-binding domain